MFAGLPEKTSTIAIIWGLYIIRLVTLVYGLSEF